jgi:AP-3 complex subunit mu
MNIVVGARPTDGKPIDDVSVRIPLPASTVSTSLTASHGVVVYDDVAKELIWKIGRLPKDRTPSLNGTVNLGATGRTAQDLSLSLFVTFKVAMYSASGLKVASLRLENEEAQPYKGVRSVTRAGCFEVRC